VAARAETAIVSERPTGTVTFLFSDIQGSTRLLESLGEAYADVLQRHRKIIRDAFAAQDGVEVSTEGDSFFAVFPRAEDAVSAAVTIQRNLTSEQWPGGANVRIRIGLHTGEGRISGVDYIGLDVHRAARIMAVAHGGQILVSDATRESVEPQLASSIELRDLGEHRLRDLSGTERLFQVIADDLPDHFPVLRSLNAVPNNLPMQSTPLVGRGTELRAIREQLESDRVRVLTLTGPGGIGKTRLALQAAAGAIERFPDGVYFVDLSPARDAPAALDAVVRSVGITISGHDDVLSEVGEQLKGRQLLLVLDNFEQVMSAADDLATLLTRCAQLKVLVTSREALRIRGEQLFTVAPLSLPDVAAHRLIAEEALTYEAVRLFVERAQEAEPRFVLTDENAVAVAGICAQLDGLPLAIELAAARLRLFSAEELNRRLQTRLEVLGAGARDLPERQRTLRSTIEWSYELLDADECSVFHLLSLFSTARVEAVEGVARHLPRYAGVDVIERLASLVDKSLVRSIPHESGQRLSMLDTIREYAAERLAADSLAADARAAHADYFVEHAESTRRAAEGDGRLVAVDELAADLGNLQSAWRYFVEREDLAQLGRLLDALWLLHDARGWYHGAVALTNDLLGLLARTAPAADRAEVEITLRLSLARGLLAIRGYTGEVEDLYREALALVEESGALPRRLPVLRSLASFYMARGEIDKTFVIGNQILELAEQQGDIGLQVEGDILVGPAYAFLGQPEEGLRLLDRAIANFDPQRHGRAKFRLGPNPGVAAHAIAALTRWMMGYPDQGDRHAVQALELGTQLQHPYSLAYATFHVGLLELWSERVERAQARAAEVIELAGAHDYQVWNALGLVLHGVTTVRLGRHEEGLELCERGIKQYENLRSPPIFWPLLLALRSDAFQRAGDPSTALELLDQAIALAGPENWVSVVLGVQKGKLLASLGDLEASAGLLQEAFDEGGRVGATTFQLRAATELVRLNGSESVERLRSTLASFAEGFDTPVLRDAQAALDEAEAG
jgi:predicted ATPase/class 3 adenylate cyclase